MKVSTIESYALNDFVQCKCGEIGVSGGTLKYSVIANDLTNVIRIDDEGNEIIPKIVEKDELVELKEKSKPNKKELLTMLDDMIHNIERLPEHAKSQPISHYDYASLITLISCILRAQD